MTFCQQMTAFRADERGAITTDFVALTAGILMLGIAVVWAIFGNGVSVLTDRLTGSLQMATVVDPGEAPSFVATLADEVAPIWTFLEGALDVAGEKTNALIKEHESGMELGSGTLAITFTMAEDISGSQTLFSKDSQSLDDGGHLTVRSDDGDLWVRLQNSADPDYQVEGFEPGSYMVRAPGQFEAGETYTLEVSFGSNGLHAYVDDQLVGANDQGFTGGIAFNREPVVIGANSWMTGDQSAEIDDLEGAFKGSITSVDLYDIPIGDAGG